MTVRRALFRAVAVYRLLTFGYAAALVVTDHHQYRRPALGWALLGVMGGWTVMTAAGYERSLGRIRPLLATDVAVAVGMVLATVAVQTSARIDAGAPTLPAAWAAASVMACAVAAGPAGGGTAAVMVAAADLVERGRLTAATFNGIVLLLLVGGVGGYLVRLALAAEASVADAARSVAAAGERERLAREIHDSTLQVLALIARRGREIGGDGTDLADLAARQEAALRSLVATAADASGAQHTDLRSGLLHLASDRITVTGPAAAVEVPDAVARAVLGAVREALANVERHAGAQAKAWVFVEAADRTLTVTVRDDGSGMPAGRLAAAAQDGRLGVAQSIVGRVAAAGGTVRIDSRPGEGTEVEITVPR